MMCLTGKSRNAGKNWKKWQYTGKDCLRIMCAVLLMQSSMKHFSKQDAETEKEIQNNMEILLKHQVGYEKNFHTEEEWETLINKYRNTRTLTKEMVNAFVEKIEIHESGSITVRLVYDDMLEELRKYAKEREAELCQ